MTSTKSIELARKTLKPLIDTTQTPLEDYSIEIQIPNYPHFISQFFSRLLQGDVKAICDKSNIPNAFGFYNFGLFVAFKNQTEIMFHDEKMFLSATIKTLIKQFGAVSFSNVVLPKSVRDENHFNNFAHLNFHRDRHDSHDNRFSLYTRNPYIKEQYAPRSASTLIVDNAVAHLQALYEGMIPDGESGRRGKYEIFRNQDMRKLMGTIILEQRWDAPPGYGEICVIDNRTVLHSSYKRSHDHGYRIGTRYLF